MTHPPHAAGLRSLNRETRIDALRVDGKLPEWLSGRLVRNGPARFEVEDQSYRHWFDGLAMLHAFGIAEGTVSYANRFLHSDAFTRAGREGRIALSEFATDPCRSIFGRIKSIFSPDLTDNASVNVTRLADRYVAMTETPMPVQFDPETLQTLGHVEYIDEFGDASADATTAHPHYEHDSGREINYTLEFGRTSHYKVVATDPQTLERELLAHLDVDRPAYMHSFGMTENYVVLTEWPLVVNPLELLASNRPFIENYRWKPELGTRFKVLRKEDGALVGEYQTEPRFGFHHVNAFEDNQHLVVDVVTYTDPMIIDELYLDRLRASAPANPAGKLERFRLYEDSSKIESRLLSREPVELPRINSRRAATQAYGCVWGVGVSEPGSFIDQIVRIDLPSGESTCWRQEGCYPGEPVFVEHPEPGAEDDGVLLSVVLDAERESSFLLVLDAHTLEELARAEVPHHIPFGFHGQFYD